MILVTGGAGFIGSNLAAALAERGIPAAICDRLRTRASGATCQARAARPRRPRDAARLARRARRPARRRSCTWARSPPPRKRDADLIVEANFRLSQMLWQLVRPRTASVSSTPPPRPPTAAASTASTMTPRRRRWRSCGRSMPTAGASSCSIAGRCARRHDGAAGARAMGGIEVLQRLRPERISQGRHAERRRAEVPAGRRR